MPAFQETENSPQVRRLGKSAWQATRHFVTLNATAAAFENTLWNSILAGWHGVLAPRCRDVQYVRNFPAPGLTYFTARFKTVRQPGIARAMGEISVAQEAVRTDINGLPVDGLDVTSFLADNGDVFFYHMTKGSPVRLKPRAKIKVETAFQGKYPIQAMMSKVGKVNAAAMRSLGLSAGTLLLMGNPFTQLWFEDDLWYADFVFLYEPKGHNNVNFTQQHSRVAAQVATMDIDGTLSRTVTRQMSLDLPIYWDGKRWKDSPEVPATMFEKTSFSDINRWLSKAS